VEEKMKIQDKIIDFSTNLVKIHFKKPCFVFLSLEMSSLSKNQKMDKTMNNYKEREKNLFIWLSQSNSLKAKFTRLK